MSPSFKSFLLIIIFLILSHAFLGHGESISSGSGATSPELPRAEAKVEVKIRKLIGLEALLDYEPPGANPSHDPKKGGSGGKGGN